MGSQPWVFLLMPILLMVAFNAGWIYLPKTEEEDFKELYIPTWSPAKAEQCLLQAHFTIDGSYHFSISRKSTNINFAFILVVSNTALFLSLKVA